jgi:hypothetical protein
MKRFGLAAALLLAGCNQGATVTKGADGSVTVAKDGQTVTVDSKDCPRAAFVPLYADAKVTTCVSAKEGKKSGTVIYTVAAAPGTVLGWYKAEAKKAGLKVTLQTDMNLSASEGKRTLMVMAMTEGAATQVSVNWGE